MEGFFFRKRGEAKEITDLSTTCRRRGRTTDVA